MISSDVIRGYNDTFILILLREHDSYGYEISRNIKLITEEKYVIKETTLYSAFSRLEGNQYITSYSGTETNGKQRTYYRITELGLEYLKDKIDEWYLTKQVVEKFLEER